MPPPELTLESRQAGSLPGDFAIWVFIFAELLVFGVLFLAYAFYRSSHVEMFNAGQLTLNREIGAANTIVLITSSYFVVRAVHAIKRGLGRQCAGWLAGANVMGGIFVVLKMIEFSQKFSAGINLSTNTFYMFYLGMTFFHFMHVLLGMVILVVVMKKAWCGGYGATAHDGVETGASYWHMVDLVWIILFALVYVIR